MLSRVAAIMQLVSFWRAFRESFVAAYREARDRARGQELTAEACGCPQGQVQSSTFQVPDNKWLLWRAPDGSLHTCKDSHHVTGAPCWCGPAYVCATCSTPAPCLHGVHRAEIVVHKEAS